MCWKTVDRRPKKRVDVNQDVMDQRFKFEKLRIWQKAMDLGEDINATVMDAFPQKERYNLSSQMMRSVDSIALARYSGGKAINISSSSTPP